MEDEVDGTCSTYGKDEAYSILDGKPEEKIPFGRPKNR
jgi:hypothetical protein